MTGRVWIVRPDPYGRPSAGAVRLSCSRMACVDQRLPNATAGRKAAVDHVSRERPHLVALVRAGAHFARGQLAERPAALAA